MKKNFGITSRRVVKRILDYFGGPASEKERKSIMTKLSPSKVLVLALGCATLVLGAIYASADPNLSHGVEAFSRPRGDDLRPAPGQHSRGAAFAQH